MRRSSQMSFGHLISQAAGSASQIATAAASGSVGVSRRVTTDMSSAERGGAVHTLPWRPRPALCSSAVTSVPCGAPPRASSLARSLVESASRR